MGGTARWRDRLLGSDPGLNRLRIASHGAANVVAAIGAERLFTLETGSTSPAPLVAMLLGAVVAMQGTLGLAGRTSGKVRIAAGFPVAMGIGLVAGTVLAGRGVLALGVFVVVQFAAVWVRRFGEPFFVYGFMGWMGYFFSSFLRASWGELPPFLEYVAIASAVVVLLSLTVLRYQPHTVLERLLAAFDARARTVARLAAELLDRSADAVPPARAALVPFVPPPTLAERLRGRLAGLSEAALMIDAAFSDRRSLLPGWGVEAMRRWLLDAQLAVEQLATAAQQVAECCRGRSDHRPVATRARELALAASRSDPAAVERAAESLVELARTRSDQVGRLACRLAAAGCDYAARLRERPTARPLSAAGGALPPRSAGPRAGGSAGGSAARSAGGPASQRAAEGGTRAAAGGEPAAPVVTLAMGALPGSAAVAGQVPPRSGEWNPLRRASLVTRQAVQAAIAAAVAIVAGSFVSPQRYYWAVIAAFVVFAGTATRAETLIKGANRILGTFVGIFVSLVVADATIGNVPAVLAVIVVSMFFTLYLQRVSYAYMVFFITIMIGELYSVLDDLSGGLLVLRLEETAIGAAVAVAVALVFLPVSTTDTARAARRAFFAALGEVLDSTAGAVSSQRGAASAAALDQALRRLDLRYQQLDQVLAPRTRSSLFGGDPERLRNRLGRYLLSTLAARELVASLRRCPAPRPALAAALADLAAASEALGGGDDSGPGRPAGDSGHGAEVASRPGAARALQAAADDLRRGALTDAGEAPAEPEAESDLVERAVVRMLLALRVLAGADPAEPVVEPAAGAGVGAGANRG